MAFQNIVGRLVDVIFGYDFFVSYTWVDGSKYAHSLYEKLKAQGFAVFLDEEEYARGDNWTLLGRRALKKTRQLALIVTPHVHKSGPVLKELTAFQSTGRRIIPIEIGDALDPRKYSESPLLPLIPAELLKITQALQQGAIPNEAPPKVIRELRRGFKHVRQAQIRIRVLLGACLVLLGLLSIAVWQGITAELQRKKAVQAGRKADRQKHEAVNQEAKAVATTKKTGEAASRGY
jgi:TIR domain